MKRIFLPLPVVSLLVLTTLLLCSATQTSYAQLISYEGFDYDIGPLGIVADPANGGTAGGTGWEKDLTTGNTTLDGSIS